MRFEQGLGAARIATSPPRSGVAVLTRQQFCGQRIDVAESSVWCNSGFAGCGRVGDVVVVPEVRGQEEVAEA